MSTECGFCHLKDVITVVKKYFSAATGRCVYTLCIGSHIFKPELNNEPLFKKSDLAKYHHVIKDVIFTFKDRQTPGTLAHAFYVLQNVLDGLDAETLHEYAMEPLILKYYPGITPDISEYFNFESEETTASMMTLESVYGSNDFIPSFIPGTTYRTYTPKPCFADIWRCICNK